MNKTEVICSEAEYDAALARISELMDALSGPHGQVADPNHPHRVELDSLVSQVERYEDEHYPIDPPSAEMAIEFHIDQTGKAPRDLPPPPPQRKTRKGLLSLVAQAAFT